MDRNGVLAILRAHEQEFRASGVSSVSLFGSLARGEATPADVDLAIRIDKHFSGPGLDHIRALDELEEKLSGLLGCSVDVVEEPVNRARFQQEIDRDRVLAF